MAQYDITALGTPLEFDTTQAFPLNGGKRLPGTDKTILFWQQSTTLFYVQCFALNRGTGAVTAIGSPLDVEAGTATSNIQMEVVVINASNACVVWTGPSGDGFMRLISIDGTGNCTANGSALEYDAADGTSSSAVLWDSTHILVVWRGTLGDGFSQVFLINTGTGVIAAVGTPFEFDAADCTFPSVAQLDSTHAIVFYTGTSADGFAIVLQVAAVTYAVTAAGSAFEFEDAATVSGNSVLVISTGSPMVVANVWQGGAGVTIKAGTFNIDTSTWAITAFGSVSTLYTTTTANTSGTRNWAIINTTTLLVGYQGTDDDGFANTLSYNSGTGALAVIDELEFDTTSGYCANVTNMDDGDGLYIIAWIGSGTDGFIQAFSVQLTASGPANLKSYDTNLKANIKSYNTNLIANVKSMNTNV